MNETFTISNECAEFAKKLTQDHNRAVMNIDSSINRHIGFFEGIGWALPKDVQPGFYDAIEALSDDIQKLLILSTGGIVDGRV